jgi:alpha-tubulin suppressor-like RCC1 family protein
LGATDKTATFKKVGGAINDAAITAIAVGGVGGSYHTLALADDGTVWAAGRTYSGQLGLGKTSSDGPLVVHDPTSFEQVVYTGTPPSGYTEGDAIAVGGSYSVILKNGMVWVTGSNYSGQLGLGNSTEINTFTQVPVTGVKAIAAGSNHTILLKDGLVYGAGWGPAFGSDDSYTFKQASILYKE